MAQGDSEKYTRKTSTAYSDMDGSLGDAGGMAQFDTVKARRVSRTMAQMWGVGEKKARSWVRY